MISTLLKDPRLRHGALTLAALLLCACAVKVETGTFHHTELIDRELRKGVSTKEDARRLLGNPSGAGGAQLPTDRNAKEVWYYEDIEVTAMKKEAPDMRVDLRQQVLLLFFDREVFDGYLWFTNAATGTAR